MKWKLTAACRTLVLLSVVLLPIGSAFSAERLWSKAETLEVLEEGSWYESLSPDVELRLNLHLERFGSLRSLPTMAEDALGVNYRPLRGLTMDVFHEVVDASPEGAAQAMLEAFNIQMVSPDYEIDLPESAVLHITLTKAGVSVHLQTKMTLRDDSYYVTYPSSMMSRSIEAIDHLNEETRARGRPTMHLSHMTGFVFNEDTIADMPPMGSPVTFNIRYGDVRVHSGFQWAGRPPEIPVNGGEEFLR